MSQCDYVGTWCIVDVRYLMHVDISDIAASVTAGERRRCFQIPDSLKSTDTTHLVLDLLPARVFEEF